MDRDHGAIGDREDVLAKAIVLLDPLAIAVEDSVVLDLGPVDGEGLGSLDAELVSYSRLSAPSGRPFPSIRNASTEMGGDV
jgi:hypothetical protein